MASALRFARDVALARRRRSGPPTTQRIFFLMFVADGMDGVCRSVINQANALAARGHQVEVISLYKRRPRPPYALDPRVRVSYLLQRTREAPEPERLRALLDRFPSRIAPASVAPNLSLLTDLLLMRRLSTLPPGILVSTRPSLHVAAARWSPPSVLTVGQEHLNFLTRHRERGILDLVAKAARSGLDAFVTLTHADAADYARFLAGTGTTVAAIPNALTWPVADTPAPLSSKVVVTAGRLVRRKGMDRLVKAFAPVARRHPDWQLHIYGKGEQDGRLRAQVARHGLEQQILLKGHVDDFGAALAHAAMFASGSRGEGFPMVMLEALSMGVPLVSFDCPRGPGELIHDEENGRLVPDGDIQALTAALEQLVSDDEHRTKLGQQALASARAYQLDQVVVRWEELFAELTRAHSRRWAGRPGRPAGVGHAPT